ncbi:16S rRNA (uracil(1498)-N(3))-methyltransferase [Polymorphobacter fuscus]|uniref:Ribosomal RNA small subunit methyltransferase E n=1 Tax=Sandarakinorhabdus fusca TaxID=1439888 RepID=A0A7C9KXV8_9SPHN|nr:16S rRNA (uracil(1498)-N(3))-methyltransferase [Polymorphobacter fuscus]KAB7644958.1 16S rRNA (uracil(1498)-N(3))-methyltransferase [Polymorphobacter fuscus]MQT18245.1 16S rRNA (uracil(1498)-N(3))-methyltransferase [Polymorphobacter fuscus]NJC09569.1 16S rRNA (uracil1498-N3)-methyltransferase [Polymorphobacter fuscus]
MSETAPDLSTTPRLYVDQPLAPGATITLPVPQSHYLAQVMRRQPGDVVRLFDGRSGEWAARLVSVGRKAVTATLEAASAPQEAVADIWLCAAPLKRGRIDWVAEKACELGVARFVPVITRRTIVDKLNLDRLRAHMVEAAEQCGRTALPDLAEPTPLAALLRDWPAGRALIFADETGGEPLPAVCARAPAPAAVLIGPEGGFTPEERAAIRAVPQALAVTLGPRILRADTAAAVAVGVWQALVGDRAA